MPSGEPVVPWTIRTELRPGDLGEIVRLHGTLYAREYGFDPTFEAYVAGPMAEFVRQGTARDRLWIAARDEQIVGCVAIVGAAPAQAQLRWFLVVPSMRRLGLGRALLLEAITFCRGCGYASVFLWTVSALTDAARLYRQLGFEKVEERRSRLWGTTVVEERYVLILEPAG
ncbi:MAG: GNAT family N-acetyltransferase [Planctomycetes bacterium]|nr:GNAT family N-acetyltransferase [Planctomycetota bacterium]